MVVISNQHPGGVGTFPVILYFPSPQLKIHRDGNVLPETIFRRSTFSIAATGNTLQRVMFNCNSFPVAVHFQLLRREMSATGKWGDMESIFRTVHRISLSLPLSF